MWTLMRFAVMSLGALCCVNALAFERPWAPVRRAAPTETLEFSVGLFQPNKEALFAEIHKRADMRHPLYAQWLSRAEVDALVAPSEAVRQRVRSQLRAIGMAVLEDRGDNLL